MAELKTRRNEGDVEAFLGAVADERRRVDAQQVCALMAQATGETPAMWGPSIVGFGSYQYTSAGGRSNDWFTVGFSPRKANLAIYLAGGLDEQADLLARLGKHKTGKSCLYVTSLAAVDTDVLREMITRSHMSATSSTR